MKRKLADWLLCLPEGKYTLSELQKISKKDKSNLCKLLKSLKITKKYIKVEKENRSVCEAVYYWKGIKNNDAE